MVAITGCQQKATMAGAAAARSNAKPSWPRKNESRRKAGFIVGICASGLDTRVAGVARLFHGRRPVHQLHQRHRRVVALAEAVLEDAQVAPVARLVSRAQLVEELHDDIA